MLLSSALSTLVACPASPGEYLAQGIRFEESVHLPLVVWMTDVPVPGTSTGLHVCTMMSRMHCHTMLQSSMPHAMPILAFQ